MFSNTTKMYGYLNLDFISFVRVSEDIEIYSKLMSQIESDAGYMIVVKV